MSCRSRDQGGQGHSRLGWLAAALALLAPLSSSARAADIETRDYTVTVSAKPAGEVHMTIHRRDDGTIWMRCDTDIKVKTLLGEYKFIYRGLEIWKDFRLVKFDSNTDDNGKRYIVTAAAENTGIRLKVNNVERMVRPHVWLTSYWSLPDPKLRNQEIPIIDADNGRDLSGTLQFVATEKVKVAGGPEIPLNHYRLRGKVNVELWYDGSDRLVRQSWKEQGHQMLVELRGVRR